MRTADMCIFRDPYMGKRPGVLLLFPGFPLHTLRPGGGGDVYELGLSSVRNVH